MSKTRIYKLINEEGKYYIGSSKKPLSIRLSEHKSSYKTNTTFKSSSSELFTNGGSVRIELIEEFDNINNTELKRYENKYIIDNWGRCVNKRCSIFDRDFYNERRRERYNKNKISIEDKEDINKEC